MILCCKWQSHILCYRRWSSASKAVQESPFPGGDVEFEPEDNETDKEKVESESEDRKTDKKEAVSEAEVNETDLEEAEHQEIR